MRPEFPQSVSEHRGRSGAKQCEGEERLNRRPQGNADVPLLYVVLVVCCLCCVVCAECLLCVVCCVCVCSVRWLCCVSVSKVAVECGVFCVLTGLTVRTGLSGLVCVVECCVLCVVWLSVVRCVLCVVWLSVDCADWSRWAAQVVWRGVEYCVLYG